MGTSSLAAEHQFTPEEYLALERAAPHKSEYRFGQIVAMAGASLEHNAICLNIAEGLRVGIRAGGGACRVYAMDVRLRVSGGGVYTYPDVAVACAEATRDTIVGDMLVNPTVIVEVLSPTTELYDRGEKFMRYQSLPSLVDYVLVSQARLRVEHFHCQESARWLLTVLTEKSDRLALPSIGCDVPLAVIYEGIEFDGVTGDELMVEE